MKEVGRRKNVKQIISIMVVIMLCNFIVPNYSYAVSTEGGGSLVKVIAQFVCFIPDVVIEFLQDMFVTPESIKVAEENYKIQYSPGTIFSGQIPAFDINFIDPMPTKVVNHVNYRYVSVKDITTGDIGNVFSRLKENRIESDGYYSISHFADSLDNEYDKICGKYNYNERDFKGEVSYSAINYDDWYGDSWGAETMEWLFGNQTKSNMFWIYDGTLYFMIFYVMDYMFYFDVAYTIFETTLTESEIQAFEEIATNVSTTPVYKESTAAILQPIVATWYNALRRIAVVGLLSVLVYIGIRILLSSTSAKEKAKYKSMLKDWLVALCLLFTLHYIMNITITVVGKINEVFSASVVGAEGEDVLMSTVREYIAKGDDWGSVLTYVVIYCVLAIYTVIFTIQYLRRTIYLAFLTMIAPLITLTYPLDKIKDKKSQAFDMWLKDYIFFTLLQVLHLLIYYVFLGSALDLANQGNWLFAIVAIGFITKAEKIMKKMFGFEKSKSMGALAAGATGALVMNLIKKIPNKAQKGGKAQGGANSGGSSNSNVRTATTSPLAALSTPSPATVNNSQEGSSNPRTQGASSAGSSQMASGANNNAPQPARNRNKRNNSATKYK